MKNRIAQLRKEIGLTQEQLAEEIGATRQTVIALEQNRYNPSLGLAHGITKALKQQRIEDVFQL